MIKILISGSRSGFEYNEIETLTEYILSELNISLKNVIVVEGGAKGVDSYARKWARVNNLPLEEYPAKWEVYGRSAGYRRNMEMSEVADICIGFCYNNSKGTTHQVTYHNSLNKAVVLVSKDVNGDKRITCNKWAK